MSNSCVNTKTTYQISEDSLNPFSKIVNLKCENVFFQTLHLTLLQICSISSVRALTALIRHTMISCPGIFTYLSEQQIKVHVLLNTINKRLYFSICLSILICKNRQKRELLENLQNTTEKERNMSLLSILYNVQSCVATKQEGEFKKLVI